MYVKEENIEYVTYTKYGRTTFTNHFVHRLIKNRDDFRRVNEDETRLILNQGKYLDSEKTANILLNLVHKV